MTPEQFMTIAKAEQIEAAVEIGHPVSQSEKAYAKLLLKKRDTACEASASACETCEFNEQCKEATEC